MVQGERPVGHWIGLRAEVFSTLGELSRADEPCRGCRRPEPSPELAALFPGPSSDRCLLLGFPDVDTQTIGSRCPGSLSKFREWPRDCCPGKPVESLEIRPRRAGAKRLPRRLSSATQLPDSAARFSCPIQLPDSAPPLRQSRPHAAEFEFANANRPHDEEDAEPGDEKSRRSGHHPECFHG